MNSEKPSEASLLPTIPTKKERSNSTSSSGSSDDSVGSHGKESPVNSNSSPERAREGSHAREKKSMRVPIIHEITQPVHPKNHSPRTIVLEHVQSDGSRLYISPRGHSPSNHRRDHDENRFHSSPRRLSPTTSDPTLSASSSKNNINLKFVSSDPEKSFSQYLSPRLEQSPRVLEARMLEMQLKYERQSAQLTKIVQKKSEDINERDMRITELNNANEDLRMENLELRAQLEQSKQVVTGDDQENIDSLSESLTNLAIENMELRTKMGKIQGTSVVCDNSVQLLSKLKKDDNIAVLKSSVFEYHQKQLSYDRSVELYEQEIRKVIHGARQSITKEKEKRKQLEQEIRVLHGKIRELEFFIIEELADLADFSDGEQGDQEDDEDEERDGEYARADPYNYEDEDEDED